MNAEVNREIDVGQTVRFSGDVFFEVSEGPEGVLEEGGVAAEAAGTGFAFGAEALGGGAEGFVDEGAGADDGTVGEVADAVAEELGVGDVGGRRGVVGGEALEFGLCLVEGDAEAWGFAVGVEVV